MSETKIDDYSVRYTLVQWKPEGNMNWVFLPGGPGADSSYFTHLTDYLDVPGNIWLMDFPNNGSNIINDNLDQFDFNIWLDIFPKTLEQFENCILVGHSFGGQLALLYPHLEKKLKGLFILNAFPAVRGWLEETDRFAKKFHLPNKSNCMRDFIHNPSPANFNKALDACMPYYFSPSGLEKGSSVLSKVPFQYQPAQWWQVKMYEMNFAPKWVPQNLPMVIISGEYDAICPYTLFQKAKQFDRPNIKAYLIEEAGHMPWIEQPEEVAEIFHEFCEQL